jgi:small subunit ribosomal protein S18
LLSQFVSETGKLLPRRKSGLSAKVHRKMVKRVKTSRIMGIIPFTERLSPTGVRKG